MRRLFQLSLLLLAAVLEEHPAFGQPAGYAPPAAPAPGQPPGYVPPTAPGPGLPPYAPGAGPGGGPEAYNTENCGTPDAPKPCPPMPRVPLQYYPANRE